MILEQPFNTTIIDDCRFENEIQMVHDMGGIVINLTRAGVTYTGEHDSEREIQGADFSVDAGDIASAVDQIEQLASL